MANPEQCAQSDGLPGLHLLPVADGIPIRDHILLAVARLLPQSLDPRSQALEKCGLILHILFVERSAYKDHVSFDTWYN